MYAGDRRVFKAFAGIVESRYGDRRDRHCPTGTAAAGRHAKLSQRGRAHAGRGYGAVAHLLPRLRDPGQTEVVIVTLPEATPVFEAERLQADLAP